MTATEYMALITEHSTNLFIAMGEEKPLKKDLDVLSTV